jgi:hypothetical protein
MEPEGSLDYFVSQMKQVHTLNCFIKINFIIVLLLCVHHRRCDCLWCMAFCRDGDVGGNIWESR